jgi:16S rRNA (cytosine1402-N4)-methyltransferase
MGENSQFYHQPVLLSEVITYLITNPEGIYVDGTLGGAGHAEAVLNILGKNARYIGIDKDSEAIQFADRRLQTSSNISYHQRNFDEFDAILNKLNITLVDGILLDLGLSSRQIDQEGRGFSYMKNTALDMRMNRQDVNTAEILLNTLSEKELSTIFFKYGEERKSRQIARHIVKYREIDRITTSQQLRSIIDRVIPQRFAIKSYARIFQALRIAVNRELDSLQTALTKSIGYLHQGGRCVVISYHSLEDRIVKNCFKTAANPCTCPPEFPQCICGKEAQIKILTPKVIKASGDEIFTNPRARSARLRVGEKL